MEEITCYKSQRINNTRWVKQIPFVTLHQQAQRVE